MGTTDQIFYLVAADHPDTWGTNIRRLDPNDTTATSNTTLTFGTSTTANQNRTVNPHTAGGVAGDSTSIYGWAIDATGVEGIDSATNARRVILAGQWNFRCAVAVPAPAAVTGSIETRPVIYVFRVGPSPGFTRTLLFSISPASQTVTALDGATTLFFNSNSNNQPDIILEPGETIHVGVLFISTQVAGLLGATVANTQTLNTGSGTNFQTVAPGIRTRYDKTASDTVATTDAGTRVLARFRAATDAVPTTESGARALVLARSAADSVPTTDAGQRIVNRLRSGEDTVPTTDAGSRVVGYFRGSTDAVPTTESGSRAVTVARGATDTVPTTDAGARAMNYHRGATDDLAGGTTTIEVAKPLPLIIVDDDVAVSIGGSLYTRT